MYGKGIRLTLPRLMLLAAIVAAGLSVACGDGEFQSVSSGELHTCGLRVDGSVDCWGDDEYGQSSPPGGIFR